MDSAGRQTSYIYSINAAKASLYNKSISSGVTNQYLCLTNIILPTGGEKRYTYTKITKNCGTDGVMESYKLYERLDFKNDGVNYNYRKYNYKYDSTGEYDGYPTYSSDASIPDTYLIKTQAVDISNNSEIYTFNKKLLCTNALIEGTNHKNETINEYDATTKLLLKTISKFFNKATGISIQRVENYQYDTSGYRDLIGYWDNQAARDANNIPTDNEHKTTYTYQTTYHFILTKTYKKDSSTTINEENTAAADGKTVLWSKVYENTVLKSQTWYDYDTYGNIKELRQYLDGWTSFIATKFDYTDNVSARNGKFNGAYLTTKWVEDVKDADGVSVTPRSGISSGIIDEKYTYDWFGNVIEKQDGLGNPTTYQYDKLSRVTEEKHPDLTFKSWLYTTNTTENSVLSTDEMNNKIKYYFDKLGNLEKEQDFTTGQYLNQYTYDNKLRLYTETNQNTSPNYRLVTYNYYSDSRVFEKVTTDKNSIIVGKESYIYDDAFSNGTYFKITKTVLGDANSPSITSNTYINHFGQVEKQGRLFDTTEYLDTFKYDYLGNKIEEKSARAYDEGWSQSWTTKYEYNYAGKPVKVTNIRNEYTTTEYDALGRVKKTTDTKGNLANPIYSTEYSYDNLGRVIEEKIPFENINGTVYNTIKRHYYDRNGNVTLEKISKNKPVEALIFNQTEYGYNSRNMLILVKTFDAGSPENYTQYYYDSVGNKLRMYTGLSTPLTINGLDIVTPSSDTVYSVTKYEYSRFNNLVKLTDPLNKEEIYNYDLNGNMNSKVDRNGSVISMTYDGLNRLLTNIVTNTSMPEYNSSISYSYTLTGNRLNVSGGSNSSYIYDNLGRLITETEGQITKEYTYDAANNRKTLIIKQSGQAKVNTSYTYDNLNRLYQVYENGQLTATYAYDSNGNRQNLTYSNGDSTDYTYNLANKLKMLSNKKGTTVLSSYTYEYSLDGNQVKKTDNTGKITNYSYDGLGRLSNEAASGENAVTYTYDDSNNRKTMTVAGGAVTTYNYDKNNRLNTESKVTGTITEITTYKYDDNGNQIYRGLEIIKPIAAAEGEEISAFVLGESTDDAGVTISGYDGFNRLVKVATGNTTSTYTYNGDGLRVSKTVNGTTTRHVWDGDQIALELDGTGVVTNKYIRGINLIVAENGTGTHTYYLYNGHGDVVKLTNSTGDVVKSYDYDAFGNEKNIDNNDTNVFRYAGEYFDREIGTIYLRARYYDPTIGRFITEDSYWGKDTDPLSLNLYTYAHNNPIMYVDPTGNIIETPWDIANVALDVADIGFDVATGDWLSLLIDVPSLLLDGAATAVPVVPGGVGVLKTPLRVAKVVKLADRARDTLRAGDMLNGAMKKALRAEARDVMAKNSKNFLDAVNNGTKLEVHHLIPLEWAHLMGKNFDPNKVLNLYGVDKETHKLLNKAWNDFKETYKKLGKEPTNQNILDFANRTLKKYGDNLIQ